MYISTQKNTYNATCAKHKFETIYIRIVGCLKCERETMFLYAVAIGVVVVGQCSISALFVVVICTFSNSGTVCCYYSTRSGFFLRYTFLFRRVHFSISLVPFSIGTVCCWLKSYAICLLPPDSIFIVAFCVVASVVRCHHIHSFVEVIAFYSL